MSESSPHLCMAHSCENSPRTLTLAPLSASSPRPRHPAPSSAPPPVRVAVVSACPPCSATPLASPRRTYLGPVRLTPTSLGAAKTAVDVLVGGMGEDATRFFMPIVMNGKESSYQGRRAAFLFPLQRMHVTEYRPVEMQHRIHLPVAFPPQTVTCIWCVPPSIGLYDRRQWTRPGTPPPSSWSSAKTHHYSETSADYKLLPLLRRWAELPHRCPELPPQVVGDSLFARSPPNSPHASYDALPLLRPVSRTCAGSTSTSSAALAYRCSGC
ncbi:hypothetical protein GGX14DRAFT_588156 [Mycena pura]|uniref:Uncharacterized protein n=1 Tax=Mycena pura TaxID=153505 RepID=A0AAD6UST5_9AGAR|nr:hypothetical protein GGX14DRAFT_588156 [Mycena pura]